MTVNQILLLRNDNDALYYDFIEYFLSAVVGKREYKMYRCDMLLSQFTTVSDEALAILIYENNRETWVDMMNNNIKKNSKISWKYTNGGSFHGEIGSSQRYHGWSSDEMTVGRLYQPRMPSGFIETPSKCASVSLPRVQ